MEALSMYLKQPNFIYLWAYIWLATLTVATAGADPISPESHSKTEEPMEVAALGRPLSLGMLYDCRKDSFITGVTLWDEKTLSENLHSSPKLNTDLKFSSSDSLSSKSNLLDVSSSLKASFLGGLVEVGGSAKFLRDTKSSNKQSRVTMYYSETTRYEHLNIKNVGQITYPEVFDQKTATHVVVAVLYGAQAFMVFDRSISEDEDKQEIEGKLDVMVRNIPEYSIEGKGSVKMKEDEKNMTESIDCTFHGDFQIKQNPTTFKEAIQTYKTLPDLLKNNLNNVVPIKIWLYPLHLLDDRAARLEKDITTSLISDTEHIMEELGEAERMCNDLFKNTLVNAFRDIKERLQLFQNSFSRYKSKLQESVGRVLPAIRGGEMEEKSLEDILKIHRSSPFSADKLNQWLNEAKTELHILSSITKMLQGINIVDSDNFITTLFDPNVDKVVCFTFTSLKYEDPYLSTLKEFLKSDELKELDESKTLDGKSVTKWVNERDESDESNESDEHHPFFSKRGFSEHRETVTRFSTLRFRKLGYIGHRVSVNSVTKWFRDPNIITKMRENLSQFKRFAEENKDEKKIRFIIFAISDPSIPGSSIYRYEKGKQTDTQFHPTFKPPPPIGPVIVGGTGGEEFSFKTSLRNSFKKIIITYNEWHFYSWNIGTSLNTIQVIFQDDQMIKVGSVAGNTETVFTFDETDKIVSATLWPNKYANRVAGLEFVVEKNDGERITMSVKCEEVGKPVIVNVRSGKCYGVEGRSGHEIDALGFYFR